MRRSWESEKPRRNEQGRVDPPAPALGLGADASSVLALQRTAGNAAVARAVRTLARDPATAPAAAPASAGFYKADGTGFTDPQLDAQLHEVGAKLGVDTKAPPSTVDAGAKAGSGDSAGAGITGQPPWVKGFQDKLIAAGAKWDDDHKAAQKLVRTFLTGWTESTVGVVAPAVAELYEHVGAEQSNVETAEFGVHDKNAKNWCQQASSSAIAEAMLKAGLRFAKPPHLHGMKERMMKKPPEKGYGKTRQIEINMQSHAYVDWLSGTGSKMGARLGTEDARGAWLLPGDIISFHAGKHQVGHTGHVATVVRGAQQPKLEIVSGNALGKAVRAEEVVRADPPKGHGSGSDARPKQPNEIFIFGVQRASILNWFAMLVSREGEMPADDRQQLMDKLAEYGLERCTPLDQMHGGGAAAPPAKTAADGPAAAPDDPYADL